MSEQCPTRPFWSKPNEYLELSGRQQLSAQGDQAVAGNSSDRKAGSDGCGRNSSHSTKRNDIVLDPFLGSGTTLLAAQRTGRRCYGIEIDPIFVDTAVTRWQRQAGEKARNRDGVTFDEVKLQRVSAMSTPEDEDRVGYKSPPRRTRWKKGQRGNPRKRKLGRREGASVTIERLLLSPVGLKIDGEPRRVPALEAVVLQLLQKTMAGNIRAARILKKYRDFAHQNMEQKLDLAFVDSAYTRAVAMLARNPTMPEYEVGYGRPARLHVLNPVNPVIQRGGQKGNRAVSLTLSMP